MKLMKDLTVSSCLHVLVPLDGCRLVRRTQSKTLRSWARS